MRQRRQVKSIKDLNEEELAYRLRVTIIAIVVSIVAITASLVLFAPKIGAIFGFVSKYRNEQVQGPEVNPSPPTLIGAPTSTNKERVTLEGVTEPGMAVKLFLNGPESQNTLADSEGNFMFTDVPLIKGKNIIFVKAVDSQNRESDKSETKEISFDSEKPEIKLETPKDGDTVRNLDKRITVKGSVNEKATVKVNGSLAVLRPDLSFEITIGVDDEGEFEIKVEAKDEAGNEAEETIEITYDQSS
jgi:hypothetical protein